MTVARHTVYGSPFTFHAADLNGLANTVPSPVSPTFDNSTARDTHMTFTLNLPAQAGPRTDALVVRLWVLPAVDGTVFDDPGTDDHPAATFRLDASSAGRQLTVCDVPIPGSKFRTWARGDMGQAFPATGTTIKGRAHSVEQV